LRAAQAEEARQLHAALEAEKQRQLEGISGSGAGVFFFALCLVAFLIVAAALVFSR
jgi:hypothetical protein